jgi:hypothetical protein
MIEVNKPRSLSSWISSKVGTADFPLREFYSIAVGIFGLAVSVVTALPITGWAKIGVIILMAIGLVAMLLLLPATAKGQKKSIKSILPALSFLPLIVLIPIAALWMFPDHSNQIIKKVYNPYDTFAGKVKSSLTVKPTSSYCWIVSSTDNRSDAWRCMADQHLSWIRALLRPQRSR